METPLRGRSGGHTGAAPTVSFGQIACGRLVSFGQIARGRLVTFGQIARGWFCLLGKRCTRTNTIGVVLFSAQGCRRKEATLGKVVGGGTYTIGIVLFKINLRAGNHPFAACGNDVR